MKLLVRHMKIKHEKDEEEQPKDLLQCNECAYQTTKQYRFQRHLRVHRESSPSVRRLFQCDKCVYKTKRKEHYIRHVNNVHTNKRPYLCDFCGKAFKRTDALKQHRVIHSTVDPLEIQFRCSVCDKNCRSHAHLLEHQAVHSNVRSFLCEICGASFKTRSVQRKHVQTIHKKPRAFSCQICDKRFNTNYALKRHVRLHEVGVDANSSSQMQINCNTASASQFSENLATAIAQQSVILLPSGDGQLHATNEELNASIPFTIHSNVMGTNSTIQLLQGADSIVSGPDAANLVPLQESISGEDGHSSAQTYIQPNEATTALLYLTTNYTHF
uniref:C2H2-type domain-containing protein n=1 Tax=Strigamia maritima TaxID=126957 RepID=T1JIR3_STRMM